MQASHIILIFNIIKSKTSNKEMDDIYRATFKMII